MFVITYIKNIIFIYIIFYLRLINSNKIISKEDVLKIKDEYYIRFYCKDEICASVENDHDNYFIEIPDINGNLTNYIVYTCNYNDIELDQCNSIKMINGENYSVECKSDLECLSNKCYKNRCTYNEETPIVHCDDIYSNKLFLGKSSYMYCGKPPGDTCKKDNECSSKNCKKNECQFLDNGPSDSDGAAMYTEALIIIGILIVIVIILIIICFCYFYKTKHKN